MTPKIFFKEFKSWTHCMGRKLPHNNVVISVRTEKYYNYTLTEGNKYKVTYSRSLNKY